jgi:hypothetical protein
MQVIELIWPIVFIEISLLLLIMWDLWDDAKIEMAKERNITVAELDKLMKTGWLRRKI